MGRDYCAYCERVGCDGDCVERRLDTIYEAAVELMIPHATTDVLGDFRRLRRHVDTGNALIDETTKKTAAQGPRTAANCEADDVRTAALALYMAGRWSCSEVPDDEAARLWADLRDALRLEPGTASTAGVSA